MERMAIIFRIRPGTEDRVRELLTNYEPPQQITDGETRLLSTSVFMKGRLVVRVIEYEGRLGALIRHVSQDPSIQRVERELDHYLVEEDRRDMSDPEGAREFFRRATMETLTTRIAPERRPSPQVPPT
ncbi:SchA/CurD-like domain-containing protein [Thermomonospora umbrina]|uniref:SchA/CurD like domain-containing protein n=1 Tax=Thermomonospora umbrina TaxID=111806 RepID=A0A3D9SYE2_9ACTN|nr:SchA/CurD-like domain-containing protein [Thermomonospora umbrina]REE97584.1 SchA/CurD like domain-containing protein [Thermomonospora umbrina]